MIDTIKGTITYATAAIALLASLAVDAWAWAQPTGGNDLAILFGVTGLIIGAVLAFLFNGENATRASRATERAVAMSSTPLTPLVQGEIGETTGPITRPG